MKLGSSCTRHAPFACPNIQVLGLADAESRDSAKEVVKYATDGVATEFSILYASSSHGRGVQRAQSTCLLHVRSIFS